MRRRSFLAGLGAAAAALVLELTPARSFEETFASLPWDAYLTDPNDWYLYEPHDRQRALLASADGVRVLTPYSLAGGAP